MQYSADQFIISDDGTQATCPACKEKCGLGNSGIQEGVKNLLKRHVGSGRCNNAKGKLDKIGKQTSLFQFLQKKSVKVPSTVQAPPPIASSSSLHNATSIGTSSHCSPLYTPTSTPPPISHRIPSRSDSSPSCSFPEQGAPRSALLRKFKAQIDALDLSLVPDATAEDDLAAFSRDPRTYVAAEVNGDDLWEMGLNSLVHGVFGWGLTSDEMKKLVRGGDLGVARFYDFVKYFIEIRGVSETLFREKIEMLGTALELFAQEKVPNLITDQHTPMSDPDSHMISPDTPPLDVLDVDSLLNSPQPSNDRQLHVRHRCSGFELTFPSGMSPHLDYPYALHQTLGLPWGYESHQGRMILRANICKDVRKEGAICKACDSLEETSLLKGILSRMRNGLSESTRLEYSSHRQLVERYRRKEGVVNGLKLQGLNDAKLLRGKATALSDYKRLVVAFRSGKVEGVDRILRVGFKRGLGARGMLALYQRAAEDAYRPQLYDEADYLRGVLFWRLGGNRLAQIAHRSLHQIPSLSTIRRNSTMPRITPSYGRPTTVEIESNIRGVLSLDELLASRQESGAAGVKHMIAMYDELSTEKRIRWDYVKDCFLGPCRDHAGDMSMTFNTVGDLVELFESLDSGQIHYASEATVGALGILSDNTRIYGARPILVSGTCKRETGPQHAKVLNTVMDAINNTKATTNLRVVSIASDGETKRGAALYEITCKFPLPTSSPIYPLLKPLTFMNLLVGDDDITCDKDYKHIFKRLRNRLLRKSGIHVLDRLITPSIIRKHLRQAGGTSEHIHSLFKPDDKQDVPLAYMLMRDIWSLPELSSANVEDVETRKTLRLLGTFFRYLIFPYICVDLSLSEQLRYLSAAVHVAMIMFRQSGRKFIPTLLYMDIMIMVKNVFFCLVKGKVDTPDGYFWVILLGTDRLETIFGILRTIIGTDSNMDLLQLVTRITGSVEVSNILVQHPEWDSRPRRLKLPAITRDGAEISDGKVDHINPASWRGDVSLARVSPQASWRSGPRLVEEELPELIPYLRELELDPRAIDMFSPLGKVLYKEPLAADDNEDPDPEEDLDFDVAAIPPTATAAVIESPLQPSPQPPLILSASHPQLPLPSPEEEDDRDRLDMDESGVREFEDQMAEIDETPSELSKQPFERYIWMEGEKVNKARAIKLYSRYRTQATSQDRLKRVQEMARFNTSNTASLGSSVTFAREEESTPALEPGDTIVTLLSCDDLLFLCLGSVTDISIGTSRDSSVDDIDLDVLAEDGVSISFQIINLVPATADDDPTSKHDWRSRKRPDPEAFTVPGQFVQPITPTLAIPTTGSTFWLLDSQELIAFGHDLLQRVNAVSASSSISRKNQIIPAVKRTREFPYREASGKACFSCETDSPRSAVDSAVSCPFCESPPIPLDLSRPQTILNHIGAHLLHSGLDGERCGLCGSRAPQCQYFLTKGANPQVDRDRTHGCSVFDSLETRGFRYATAAESTAANPCSNVPIHCKICFLRDKKSPAIWKYHAREHYKRHHSTANLNLYSSDWELSTSEKEAMKVVYSNRKKKPTLAKSRAKEKRKKEIGDLIISEAHSSRRAQRHGNDLDGSEQDADALDSDNDDLQRTMLPRPKPRRLPRQLVSDEDDTQTNNDGAEYNNNEDVDDVDEDNQWPNDDEELEYVSPDESRDQMSDLPSSSAMEAAEREEMNTPEAVEMDMDDVPILVSPILASTSASTATVPPTALSASSTTTAPTVMSSVAATTSMPPEVSSIPGAVPGVGVSMPMVPEVAEVETTRRSGRKRKGTEAASVLSTCICGQKVTNDERLSAAQCTRAGCETFWSSYQSGGNATIVKEGIVAESVEREMRGSRCGVPQRRSVK
ncbi:hypothetical protein BDZ89DRAFT_1122423 [Hymenopellis radicata]|nr:hypothetical protein BDZ89DRAFT_1122423 [Hymenopellis radicata]